MAEAYQGSSELSKTLCIPTYDYPEHREIRVRGPIFVVALCGFSGRSVEFVWNLSQFRIGEKAPSLIAISDMIGQALVSDYVVIQRLAGFLAAF